MGGNESKEADASLLGREGEDDIFRDLLEVDGCESSWQDGDRRAEAVREVEEKEALAPVIAEQQTQEDGGPGDGVLVEASNRACEGADATPNGATNVPCRQPNVTGRISCPTTKDSQLLLGSEGRPLAEPPMFNYDLFVRNDLPSEAKLYKMFGDDAESKTSYRDVVTENQLLLTFRTWIREMIDTFERSSHAGEWRPGRDGGEFYLKLHDDVDHDYRNTSVEVHRCIMSMTDLQNWESWTLDNDDENDNTAKLKRRLARGLDPFHDYKGLGDRYAEARLKYDYLLDTLSRRPSHDIETWIYHQHLLGSDGANQFTSEWHTNITRHAFTGGYFRGKQAKEDFLRYEQEVYGGESSLSTFFSLETESETTEKERRLDAWYGRLILSAPPAAPPAAIGSVQHAADADSEAHSPSLELTT